MSAQQVTTIPAVAISFADGHNLSLALNQSDPVRISIGGAGPTSQLDWDAIRAVAIDTVTASNDPLVYENRAGTRTWDAFIANNTDPCLDRIAGITCLHGRIVELDGS